MTTEEIAETAWTTLNLKRTLGASEEALRATCLSAMRAVEQETRERCAAAVCAACALVANVIYKPAEYDGFGWHHQSLVQPGAFEPCRAGRIKSSK